jgi:branched-chain amino acid transport system permease protein
MAFIPTGSLILFLLQFFLFVVIGISLNLEFGLTGIPNFGKVLFIAAGGFIGSTVAYRLEIYIFGLHSTDIFESSPIFSNQTITPALANDPLLAAGLFVVIIAVGAAVAAALGYLSSYPAIRLREDYLGMLLLGAAELFSVATEYYKPIVGGPENFLAPDLLKGFGSLENYATLAIFAVAAAAAYVYAERVAKSPMGRALRAVRDNEDASEALGKDNVSIRRKMLVIASAMSGMAGALWAIYWAQQGALAGGDIASTFPRVLYTFLPWTLVILGGAANNKGVLLGAFILVGLQTLTTEMLPGMIAGANIPGVSLNLLRDVINSFQYVSVGTILIVILLFRPEGLIPEKPAFTLAKSQLADIHSRVTSEKASQAANTEKKAE